MSRPKRKSKLRPKTPARVRKVKKKASRPRGLQHPELWGLGLIALGVFLGSVIYLGWNGGYVGRALADGLDALVGEASWGMPVALVVLGGLMVARSALVDVRPFRTGLGILAFGLMITLGRDQGGYLGQVLGGAVGVAIGVEFSKRGPLLRRRGQRSAMASANSRCRPGATVKRCATPGTCFRSRQRCTHVERRPVRHAVGRVTGRARVRWHRPAGPAPPGQCAALVCSTRHSSRRAG